MELILAGHNYKYAVEQIMLALFPQERPEYGEPKENGMSAKSSLSFGGAFAQSVTVIKTDRGEFRGIARTSLKRLTGSLVTERLLQRLVKQSFFRAAEGILQNPPVWGSLTGIRPAKIAESALSSGATTASTAKMLVDKYYVSPERAVMCVDAAQAALTVKRTLKPRDVSVYIGIPFCPSRCAYCSFVSNSVAKSFGLVDPFTETLLNEIALAADTINELGLCVTSVYIGGGTPTALPADALGSIMASAKRLFDLSQTREYTVEAGRPDTVTREKLDVIKRMGADRVCVNPQSMSVDVLSAIGRRHTPEDAINAALQVKRGGFALNMDIIAGLPEDTREGFKATLDTVIGVSPENITVHTLSLKKGSRIMLENPVLPDGPAVAHMLGYAGERLRESGYAPYYLYRQKYTSGGFENIGWSRPGHEGIYNICMMEELCTVVSLGGGGVTKIVTPDGRIERMFNAKYPREYILQKEKTKAKFERIKELYRGM